jgi:hypothetical protein
VAHASTRPVPAPSEAASPTLVLEEAHTGLEADASPGEASPARALAQAARTLVSAARWDVLVLAALGAAAAWRTRRSALLAGALVLVAWIAAAAVHARSSGYLGQRHMLGPVQLLFPVAGLGLQVLWDAGRLRLAARVAAGAVVLLAAFGGVKDRHHDDAARIDALALARDLTTPEPGGPPPQGWLVRATARGRGRAAVPRRGPGGHDGPRAQCPAGPGGGPARA